MKPQLLQFILAATSVSLLFFSLTPYPAYAQTTPIRVAAVGGNTAVVRRLLVLPEIQITHLSVSDVKLGLLNRTRFDAVVISGGNARSLYTSLGLSGRENIKSFVNSGGAYIGIASGAYLAASGTIPTMSEYRDSDDDDDDDDIVSTIRSNVTGLGLVNLGVSSYINGGRGVLSILFEPPLLPFLSNPVFQKPIRAYTLFYNGPLWENVTSNISRKQATVLARLTGSSGTRKTSASVFANRPAIILDTYGQGCVFVSSVHLELTTRLRDLVLPDVFRYILRCNRSPSPTITSPAASASAMPTTVEPTITNAAATPSATIFVTPTVPYTSPTPSLIPTVTIPTATITEFPSPTAPLPSSTSIPTPTVLPSVAQTVTPSPSPNPIPSPSPTLLPTFSFQSCPGKPRGDADCDGRVSLVDFEIWRQEYTDKRPTSEADFTIDQSVTISDYEIWRRNFF